MAGRLRPSNSSCSSSAESAATSDDALEFIFLGTGTSSSIPQIDCLTTTEGPQCKTCTSALRPDGQKNIRRNTSAVFRVNGQNGKKAYVTSIRHLIIPYIDDCTARLQHNSNRCWKEFSSSRPRMVPEIRTQEN